LSLSTRHDISSSSVTRKVKGSVVPVERTCPELISFYNLWMCGEYPNNLHAIQMRRNEFVDLDFMRVKVATSELERIYGSEVTLSYQLKNLRKSEECDEDYKDDLLRFRIGSIFFK
jgi:hypothetical protein